MTTKTKIDAFKLQYGKRNLESGGWHYTKSFLGTIVIAGDISLEESERVCRREYPEANSARIFEIEHDGALHWVCSTSL